MYSTTVTTVQMTQTYSPADIYLTPGYRRLDPVGNTEFFKEH